MTPLQTEISELIVSTLSLEVDAKNILPREPLFGDGLGLDSIDALELALEISQRYGVAIRSDDENKEHIFSSLEALAKYIEENRSM